MLRPPSTRMRKALFSQRYEQPRSVWRTLITPCVLLLVAVVRKLPYQGRDRHDILIVSIGGVGTTSLIEHLGKFRSVNDPHDHDSLKHRRLAGRRCKNRTVIVVRRETRDVVSSLRRRGILEINAAKLGLMRPILLSDDNKLLEIFEEAAQSQLDSWRQRNSVLALEYESLPTSAEAIANFIGVDALVLAEEFPFSQASLAARRSDEMGTSSSS